MERAHRRSVVQCYWILLVLLVTWGNVVRSDLYRHMEDAFAEDARGTTCRRSERTVVCRLGSLRESSLSQLDPCLCTHLVYSMANDGVSESLRRSNENLVFLLTMPLEELLKGGDSRTELLNLVETVQRGGFEGVDVTVRREPERSKSLNVLQELYEHLTRTNANRTLRLTFVGFVPTAPFIAEIMRIDVASFTFFTQTTGNESQNLMQLEQISELGIPRNKTLQGMSMRSFEKDSHENKTTVESFQQERCSEILSLASDQEVPSSKGSGVQSLRNKVEYMEQSKTVTAGIDIWSLADDDTEGICGKGSFPILRHVSHATNQDSQPFDEFADLDIVLSTGESQELQFLQDLDVTPDEMKKLPCDRVGFYRHPSDCSKFYHCSEFRTTKLNHSGPYAGFLYKCPHGLVYDERQGSCIWPSWSDPCKGSGELLPVPAKKFSCIVPGFHVDPENCRWFYYCSDLGDGRLEAFEFLCPSDLLGYDEKKMLCNWKWTVPACVNHGKSNTETTSTPSTQETLNKRQPQNRTAKALKVENIHKPSTSLSSHITSKPVRVKLNPPVRQRNSAERKETRLATTDGYVPFQNDQQQFATTENAVDKIETVKMENNSSPNERYANGEQNLPEKKYGTAVWRRSWVNPRIPKYRIPQINQSDDNFSGNRIKESRLQDEENYRSSNQNDLEINTKNRRVSELEDDDEPERFVKAVVRNVNVQTGLEQTPELKQKDEKNVKREMSNGHRNPKELPVSEIYDYKNNDDNLFHNTPNRELDRDTRNFSDQRQSKNTPFLNVRCSKLENGKGQLEEINTFGCTSEVSLTIQVRSGKDPSKYILKEDQITRTSLQESQQIRYAQHPRGKNNTNSLGLNAKDTNKIQRINSPTLFISSAGEAKRNESSISLQKIRSSDVFILEALSNATPNADVYAAELNKGPNDTFPEYFAESSLTKSHESYDIKMPNIEKLQQNTSIPPPRKSIKLLDGNSSKVINDAYTEHTMKKNHDSVKSMPIHFYPQGVLLNIDITHINEIPPQILLEVDNMLKKYMNDGKIDLNLLERKLNASTEIMVRKEKESMEPEEIMEMIKVIENIINTSREIETAVTEINPSYTDIEDNVVHQTETYIGTSSVTNEETEYANITSLMRNISDRSFNINKFNDSNGVKTPLTNDKILNPEISANNSETPFDRRRLLRKFRHPSIREQLERQNQFRNAPETVYKNTRSEIISSGLGKIDSPVSDMPKRNEKLDQSNIELNSNFYKQSALTPTISHDTSRASIQQFGGRIVAWERRGIPHEENYNHASVNQALVNKPEENNVLRPSSLARENWKSLQDNVYVNPSVNPISLPISSGGNIRIENSRTFQDETYKYPLVNRPLPPRTQENNVQRSRTSQYGDRSRTLENRAFHDETFVHSSLKLASSRSDENSETESSRKAQENTKTFDEVNRNYNLQRNIPNNFNFERESRFAYNREKSKVETTFSVTSDNQAYDYYNTKPGNIPLFRRNETERSFDYKNSGRNVRTNRIHSPAYSGRSNSEGESFDTNTLQTRKKRKLRILVRKMTDSESVPRRERIPLKIEAQEIEENIPKNVLSALKSRILQKHARGGADNIELQIQYQDHVWNIPFVNNESKADLSPDICTRPGLFQHPRDCNMFYECFWDKWLQRYTLHVFSCPVRLVYDENVRGCSRPSADSLCRTFTK